MGRPVRKRSELLVDELCLTAQTMVFIGASCRGLHALSQQLKSFTFFASLADLNSVEPSTRFWPKAQYPDITRHDRPMDHSRHPTMHPAIDNVRFIEQRQKFFHIQERLCASLQHLVSRQLKETSRRAVALHELQLAIHKQQRLMILMKEIFKHC